MMYLNVHDFTFASLRYFCAPGSYEGLGYTLIKEHILPILVERAYTGDTFTINGDDYDTVDGTNVRDYTYVLDIAMAHIAPLNYLFDGGDSDIFNIGGGHSKVLNKLLVKLKNN